MHRFARFRLLLIAGMAVTAFTASNQAADDVNELVRKAREASAEGKHRRAVELLDEAIAAEGMQAGLFRLRGREHFRSGDVEASIEDFDRVAKLAPAQEKTLWERGISHYYAGRFDDGAKQFELYQTYHDADVENATWRYLCVARSDSVDKARATLLPIKNDRRVPMMEIYAMYQGKLEPDEVLAAAKAGQPNEAELNRRLFYAHLYIGLFHEAAGREDQAEAHIRAAVGRPIGHYMHDVARVHLQRLERQRPKR